MINYHENLITALEVILPTYYEMTLHSGINTPCISYMELNNYAVTEPHNHTLGYSRITYQVKVWGNDIGELQRYAVEIDTALSALGFKRTSSGELYDKESTMIQKILTYECLALENIN